MFLDGEGHPLISFRCSPPQTGEMKRGLAAGLKGHNFSRPDGAKFLGRTQGKEKGC